MQLKTIVFAAVQIAAVFAADPLERRDNTVHTALKVYHTIINESPFLVDRTSTVIWTEGASISDTSLPTSAPTPTIGY
ncbi:hypothetical protein BDN70DRAFT_988760 [Pholiota conissans]|uniref:Uncharacterized protein n=1 Tax=Pholiota conissans TaxID=109636 RepID=A0A9P6CYR5_9AGAR|nr:hypothetical protein BDN70DRAFT_988760 [Pholiota conissans]